MTDDIVQRLRSAEAASTPASVAYLCTAAADEIERLRTELAVANTLLQGRQAMDAIAGKYR